MRLVFLVAVAVATVSVVAAQAGSGAVKPMIGSPVTAPAKPAIGKPLTVAFRVTRSDTGRPLTAGTMTCDPSLGGAVIAHSESFRNGIARVSFVVPDTAEGKTVKVSLAIWAYGRVARTSASFRIPTVPKPWLTVADASAAEGDAGTTGVSVPVRLSAPSTRIVSVDYATADGTALAGSDYAPASGTLTFAPGETAQTITVGVAGDTTSEENETFTVTLSNPANATIAHGTASVTIVDDELILISPAEGATVPQNDPATGCPLDPARGYGLSTTFAWTTHRSDITSFHLHVQHRGSIYPIVDVVLGADARSFTHRECHAYVADPNLDGWDWSLDAIDSHGTIVASKHGTYVYAPCRRSEGTACYP